MSAAARGAESSGTVSLRRARVQQPCFVMPTPSPEVYADTEHPALDRSRASVMVSRATTSPGIWSLHCPGTCDGGRDVGRYMEVSTKSWTPAEQGSALHVQLSIVSHMAKVIAQKHQRILLPKEDSRSLCALKPLQLWSASRGRGVNVILMSCHGSRRTTDHDMFPVALNCRPLRPVVACGPRRACSVH